MVGLAGRHAAFVAVGFVCGAVRSARVSVYVWNVAAGERLEQLAVVSSAFLEGVTVR